MSTLETAIAFFRRQREALFRAECRVERLVSEGIFDSGTGQIGDPVMQTIYEGRCNVREMTWEGTDVRTGEREVRLQRGELSLPHDTDVRENDLVTVTASDHDSSLVDQVYRVTDVFLDAWQVVRRAIMEKVTD